MFELLEQLLRGWDVCVLPSYQESRLLLSGYPVPRFSMHTYVCVLGGR